MNKMSRKEKSGSRNRLYIILNFTIVFIILSTLALLIFSYIETNSSNAKRTELEHELNSIVQIESSLLAKEFDSVISDLNYLYASYRGMLFDGENKEKNKEDWRLFSENRMIYDQIRFIDIEGNEVIRINYSDGAAYIVEDEKLQNKKDRYYFYEAIDLEEGQVFVSRFDLNIENGEIEKPLKPMIRFCTPVYDNSKLLGVIVLNYLAEGILNEFDDIAHISEGQVCLLNSDSYYLAGNDSEKLWSFMYDENSRLNFKNDYSKEWNQIVAEEELIYTENGLFVSANVVLLEKFETNNSKQSKNEIILDEGSWVVVALIPETVLLERAITSNKVDFYRQLFKKNAMYFGFILVVAAFIAFISDMQRTTKKKIKFHAEYDAMTKVLNRRAGLEKLESIIPTKSKRSNSTCISFIDVNGLKEVNDKLGHDNGDELIITVANVISDSLGNKDFLIRMGGDEFLIVFEDSKINEAENIWGEIVTSFTKINENEKRPYVISVSHGIVELDSWKDRDIDSLVKIADEKMYSEKRRIKVDLRIIKD